MDMTLPIVISIVVVVGGTIVALVWWKMADRIFPGADAATGQSIKIRKRKKDESKQVVIKGFDGGAGGGTSGGSGGRGLNGASGGEG